MHVKGAVIVLTAAVCGAMGLAWAFDCEPVKLFAVMLAQLDLERVPGEQLVFNYERQVPDPALNAQRIGAAHHRGVAQGYPP